MKKILKYSQIVEEIIYKDEKEDMEDRLIYPPVTAKMATTFSKEKSIPNKIDKTDSKTDINVRLKFSKKLKEILEVIEDNDSFVSYEILLLDEPNCLYHNGLKIENVDISSNKSSFDITISGRKISMKIENFIKYYFTSNYFKKEDITEFIDSYNLLVGVEEEEEGDTSKLKREIPKIKVEIPTFSYSPDNVRRTFISLVTKTYPNGTENKLLPFLPKLDKDDFDNYYKIIGDKLPSTMFACHLDTAGRKESDVILFTKREQNNDEIIYTDGNTILGADDKAGTAIMLYMMDKKVPGLYYFFIGEEVGGVGSSKVSRNYKNIEYLKELKRCISFDRRGYRSVITKQLGRSCCSDIFAISLSKEYNDQGFNLSPDPTGIYTDSASFVDYIPECTNISVGYQNEHSGLETQNIDYLIKLAKASVKVNWDSLPSNRKLGLDDIMLKRYSKLIQEINIFPFEIDVRIITEEDDSVFIRCDLEDGFITETYESLHALKFLLQKNSVKQTVYFDDEYIKIKLAKDNKFNSQLKKYENRIGFDDLNDDPFNGFENEDSFEEIDDINVEDQLNHLCYLFREMFNKKGIYYVSVHNEDMNIIINTVFDKVTRLEKVIEVFSIANKIKKEFLVDYISSFQIYEERNGDYVITFEYILYKYEDDYDNRDDNLYY